MKPRFLFCIACFTALAFETGVSQAQPPSIEPLSQELRNRVDVAFTHIASAKLGGSAKAEVIRTVVAELELQLGFVEKKLRRVAEHQDALLQQWNRIQEEEQKNRESIGFSSASRETIETLLRNCELEMQRLRWQAAAEETTSNATTIEKKERLSRSRIEDIDAQIADAETQVDLQARKLQRIEQLMKAGQIPSSELMEQQTRMSEIQSVLNTARRRREEVGLQLEIEQATELEKTQLARLRIERQRDVLMMEVEELGHGLQRLSGLERNRFHQEVCEDRMREYSRVMGQLEVQRTELEVLIEILTSQLALAEGK